MNAPDLDGDDTLQTSSHLGDIDSVDAGILRSNSFPVDADADRMVELLKRRLITPGDWLTEARFNDRNTFVSRVTRQRIELQVENFHFEVAALGEAICVHVDTSILFVKSDGTRDEVRLLNTRRR